MDVNLQKSILLSFVPCASYEYSTFTGLLCTLSGSQCSDNILFYSPQIPPADRPAPRHLISGRAQSEVPPAEVIYGASIRTKTALRTYLSMESFADSQNPDGDREFLPRLPMRQQRTRCGVLVSTSTRAMGRESWGFGLEYPFVNI
jgi:hypothetical protein